MRISEMAVFARRISRLRVAARLACSPGRTDFPVKRARVLGKFSENHRTVTSGWRAEFLPEGPFCGARNKKKDAKLCTPGVISVALDTRCCALKRYLSFVFRNILVEVNVSCLLYRFANFNLILCANSAALLIL